MTIIYATEYNTKCYRVTLQNKGWVRVRKKKDVSEDENILYQNNPMETFLGKSQLCEMTKFSGARDKDVFDGNTSLLKIGEENNKHWYMYIGGDMVCSFLTSDRLYKSNIRNNLTPWFIALGLEKICYLAPYFIFGKKENIDENGFDKLFDYQKVSNCRKLRVYKIHSNYD